jgi:riboflavin kinase/FMN adenylyltransferase
VYVGENFRFGEGRRGDTGLLAESAASLGLRFFSASRVTCEGEPVSSTAIRARLEAGDVAAANARLGYAYFSSGW